VWLRKIGAEKMTQLLDRVWCRIFHKQYHVPQEALHGWQFIHCLKCKITWPQRSAANVDPNQLP
jgi:hypothetical protein